MCGRDPHAFYLVWFMEESTAAVIDLEEDQKQQIGSQEVLRNAQHHQYVFKLRGEYLRARPLEAMYSSVT